LLRCCLHAAGGKHGESKYWPDLVFVAFRDTSKAMHITTMMNIVTRSMGIHSSMGTRSTRIANMRVLTIATVAMLMVTVAMTMPTLIATLTAALTATVMRTTASIMGTATATAMTIGATVILMGAMCQLGCPHPVR